ncbi:uncharacterized protein LOC144293899 [Canis aureus]
MRKRWGKGGCSAEIFISMQGLLPLSIDVRSFYFYRCQRREKLLVSSLRIPSGSKMVAEAPAITSMFQKRRKRRREGLKEKMCPLQNQSLLKRISQKYHQLVPGLQPPDHLVFLVTSPIVRLSRDLTLDTIFTGTQMSPKKTH